MSTLHVVIPHYNEGTTILCCVERVLAAGLPDGWDRRVLIVDDASASTHSDALDEALASLRETDAPIDLHRHEINRGKGAALQTGFDALLAANLPATDLVIIQDADLEYDPGDYAALMTPLLDDAADAVIGTRWGDHHPIRGLKRRLHAAANGFLTLTSNLMTGYRVHDMECCYKVMSIAWLGRVRPWLTEPRYGVEPQLVAVLAKLHARVTEVAVSYDPRSFEEGKKIGWRDGVRALWVIARERLRRIRPGDGSAS